MVEGAQVEVFSDRMEKLIRETKQGHGMFNVDRLECSATAINWRGCGSENNSLDGQ